MTVNFQKLPSTVQEFEMLVKAGLDKPERTAALFICAIHILSQDRQAGIDAINLLKGPAPLSLRDIAWFKDRIGDKLYLPMAYFNGSTPENSYTPTMPYTLTFTSDPRPQDCEEGYIRLYIKTPAFDTPRAIKLRQKGSEWFAWEYSGIMMGVRTRAKDDPWA